jgi:hypothetical protein
VTSPALPSEQAILERAKALGLTGPDGGVAPRDRSRVARILQDESRPAPKAGPVLLSRFTRETDAGLITVDVTLTPHQKD